MAASLLRIRRQCFVKCLQAESWTTLRRAPSAAAYSTKSNSAGSEKFSKMNTDVDPIKKALVDAIREYNSKSKASGGPVGAGPEYQKKLTKEITFLRNRFGGGDLESFPKFTFKEPTFKELK